MENKKIYQGLTIDGGGILGIGAAKALMEFEKRSGKPIIEQFDFIAGTSTGGIVAVMLGLGYSAEDTYNLYVNSGDDIFYIPTWRWKLDPRKPKYSNEKFIKILDSVVGDKKMSDLKIPTYITTTNIVKNETHVFSRKEDVLLRDVVLRTTAAPTYFQAQGEWVDGGLWANDPSLVGTLGFKRFKQCEFNEIKVLSIGTGGDPVQKSFDTSKMTVVHWIKPLLQFLFVGTEHATEFFMRNLGLADYERIDPEFKKGYKLDDVDKMSAYAHVWDDVYEKNKIAIRKFFR